MLIERENGQCDADQRNDGGIAQQGDVNIDRDGHCCCHEHLQPGCSFELRAFVHGISS